MSQVDSVCADKTCLSHMYNTSLSNQHMSNNYMVPTKKIDSNSRTFQDFPGLLASKFQDLSRTFDKISGLFRIFTELCEWQQQNLFFAK